MDNYAFFVGIILIIILLYVFRGLFRPMRYVFKFIFNSILGVLALLLCNNVGGNFGWYIAINWYNLLICGFLGIPGFILIILLKIVF